MECAKNRPLPLYVLNCCALSVNWDGETAAECIVRVNYNQFISKSLNLGQEKKWPTLSSGFPPRRWDGKSSPHESFKVQLTWSVLYSWVLWHHDIWPTQSKELDQLVLWECCSRVLLIAATFQRLPLTATENMSDQTTGWRAEIIDSEWGGWKPSLENSHWQHPPSLSD